MLLTKEAKEEGIYQVVNQLSPLKAPGVQSLIRKELVEIWDNSPSNKVGNILDATTLIKEEPNQL